MADLSAIRKHMPVIAADGGQVGTVDDIGGDHIKLTKTGSSDGQHHRIPADWIDRVDTHVHLNRAAATLGFTGATGTAAAGTAAGGAHEPHLPPIANPAIGDGVKRSNYYLPWVLLALVLLAALLFGLKSCGTDEAATTAAATPATAAAALPVETVTLPNGRRLGLAPNTLNYELQRYLASDAAAPRTFTFDKLNFDTGAATIRAEDQDTIDALAQVLAAYPAARAQVVGYADARGAAGANATLGADRAAGVKAALVAKGIDAGRLDSVSGGETNPKASNASAEGQFENRRTELVVTAK